MIKRLLKRFGYVKAVEMPSDPQNAPKAKLEAKKPILWNNAIELWDETCRESLEHYLFKTEPGKILMLLMVHWMADANEKACEQGITDREHKAGIANGLRKMRSNLIGLTIKPKQVEGPMEVTDEEIEKRLQARALHRMNSTEVVFGP